MIEFLENTLPNTVKTALFLERMEKILDGRMLRRDQG